MPKDLLGKGLLQPGCYLGLPPQASIMLPRPQGPDWVFPKAFRTIGVFRQSQNSTLLCLTLRQCSDLCSCVSTGFFCVPTATVIIKSPLKFKVSCLINIHPPFPPHLRGMEDSFFTSSAFSPMPIDGGALGGGLKLTLCPDHVCTDFSSFWVGSPSIRSQWIPLWSPSCHHSCRLRGLPPPGSVHWTDLEFWTSLSLC